MTISCDILDRRFSAANTAKVSGVSQELQRDWRRREILPPWDGPGRKHFDVGEVIELFILKIWSDAGIGVAGMRPAAAWAVLQVSSILQTLPGAFTVNADEDIDQGTIDALIHDTFRPSGKHGRYLWIAPRHADSYKNVGELKGSFGDQTLAFARNFHCKTVESLEQLQPAFDDSRCVSMTVVDMQRIAETILERADGPLFTAEIHRAAK